MDDTKPYREPYINDKNIGMSEATTHKQVIRPNNYAIKVAILSGSDSIALPISKVTGKGSKREYEYLNDVTIEKTSKSMIIYLKRLWVKAILKPDDAIKEDEKVREFLTSRLLEFMQKYPQTKLDWVHAGLIRREIGVKDKRLRLAKDLRIKDDIFKKVYPKEVEFYNPVHLKNYLVNMSLKNLSPELADSMKIIIDSNVAFAENLRLHREVMKDISTTLVQLQNTLKPREGWLSKIRRFLWK